MNNETSTISTLPGIAFATLPRTGETIAICRGGLTFYRVGTTKSAAELNAMYGVSEAQAREMFSALNVDWSASEAGANVDAHGES